MSSVTLLFALGLLAIAQICSAHDMTTAEPGPEVKQASRLDLTSAETALFLLVAVCFVLLLATIMLTVNYCGLQGQYKKLQAKMNGNSQTV